ncbi:MAG TPA: carboxypeptidase-like regulatory domain-containing protein, partial [Saprospiraceae bacterium]|nr:carboxypeptidase-like regulatory domain-containing protein [Saprospiraceae bacterium]
MRYLYILLAALLSSTLLPAQTPHTQTIRGIVTDKITKTPLIGVNVLLLNTGDELNGTVTDYDGSYLLEKVPMGRRSIEFSYIGYNKISLDNIVVSSGREVVLNVEMEESVTELKTVEVAARRSGDTRNE